MMSILLQFFQPIHVIGDDRDRLTTDLYRLFVVMAPVISVSLEMLSCYLWHR